MFREVVAIGNSSLRTDEYAAEIGGTPTALIPIPRMNNVITRTETLQCWELK
jgi:hypothetical protein